MNPAQPDIPAPPVPPVPAPPPAAPGSEPFLEILTRVYLDAGLPAGPAAASARADWLCVFPDLAARPAA